MRFTQLDLENLRDRNQEAEHFQFSPTLNILIVPPESKIPLIRSLETLLCRYSEEGIKRRFQSYSLAYRLKNGDEYTVSFTNPPKGINEANTHQRLNAGSKEGSRAVYSFPESALSISAELFNKVVFPVMLPPTAQYMSTSLLLDYLEVLRDEGIRKPLRNALKELEDAMRSLGDEEDTGSQLGRVHARVRELEIEYRESEEKQSHLLEFTSRIQQLRQKKRMLIEKEKSLREKLAGEKEKKTLEKWKRIGELEKELVLKDSELESCRAEKEKITEKASACREKIRDKDGLVSLSVDLNALIRDFENTGVAQCLSNTEKEKLIVEIGEKEVELNGRIETLRPAFGHYRENESFESHIDSIEKKLTETRELNKLKEQHHNAQKKRDALRRTKFLFFIPALVFTALLLSASIFNFLHPLPHSEVLLPSLALFCLFFFLQALRFFHHQRREMRDMKKAEKEISLLKSSIDEAKSELAVLQKELGVVTTTDIRNRYHDWMGFKRDLESLHRVKELQTMVRSRLDDERARLETELRTILKNCAMASDRDPITPEILAQLSREYAGIKNLQAELDVLGTQYRKISDGMSELQEARAAVKKEMQGFSSSREGTADLLEYKYVLGEVSAHEEAGLAISDYDKDIAEKESSLRELKKGGRETVEIDEELLCNVKNRNVLEKRKNAIILAAGEISRMEKLFMERVYTPFFNSFSTQFFDTFFPAQDQAEYKVTLDRLLNRDLEPVRAQETEIDGLINFLLSLIIRHSFSSVITRDVESLPLLIDLDKLSGFKKVGRFIKGLESLIALSKWTQLFFLTEEQTRGEFLQGLVVSANMPCMLHKTPQMMLITAEELFVDDDL